MEIQSVLNADATRRGASDSSSSVISNELGKDQFLQLLVVQMEYQDPLNPMDNSQMIAQLAQFSALEQMQNLNASFSKIQHQGNLSQAMALSGKNVHLEFQDGSSVDGWVEKVVIQNGDLFVQIDGVFYPARAIVSIAFLNDEETEAADDTQSPDDADDSSGADGIVEAASPDYTDVGAFSAVAGLMSN